MKGKITLITPPDIFENEDLSILFIHLDDRDQEKVSEWFAKSNVEENINIYFYDLEVDLPWLFYSIARADYIVFNIDGVNDITKYLSGYVLGKKKTFFKTSDNSVSSICSFINQNRITNIELLLERIFDVENRT